MKNRSIDNLDFVEALTASGWFSAGEVVPGVSVFIGNIPDNNDKIDVDKLGNDGGAATPAPDSLRGDHRVASSR